MATAKFCDLKAGLLESLRPVLAKDGFSLNAKRGRFIRKRGDVTDDFTLQCRDGKPGCRVEPDVGVRFEIVEEIYHRTSMFGPKYHKNTVTVGGSVGELSNRLSSASNSLPNSKLEFLASLTAF